MAEATPAHRNRAVDFYRVVAIAMVVSGHWLVNAFQYEAGALSSARILTVQPWTQFLTWVFQVMPVFFLVGGYSNAASWRSVRTDPVRRNGWAGSRVRRLLLPVLPLVAFWALFAVVAVPAGLEPDLARAATRGGLIPTWFLAVYAVVTLCVPLTFALWERIRLFSVALFGLAAVAVDALAFINGAEWLRWVNYAFVWLAVHQLGYWWLESRPARLARFLLVACGAAVLWTLVAHLGYPVSMISIPGAEVSNSSPPTVAMLAIASVQAGLLLALEAPVGRLMKKTGRWVLVILASARIMTIYLWHTTALVALVGIAFLLDGAGLAVSPGTGAWWLVRPVWIIALSVALFPFIVLFGWVEARAQRVNDAGAGGLRVVVGTGLSAYGLAALALDGAIADNAFGLNAVPVLAVLAGVGLAVWRTRAPDQ